MAEIDGNYGDTKNLVPTFLVDIEGDAVDIIERADGKKALAITLDTTPKTPLVPSAPAAASVGVTSDSAVAANADRKGLILVNTSSNFISLGFGAAAVLYSGVTLNPNGGTFVMDEYSYSIAAIYAIASGAASNLGVQEFE